MDKQKKNKKPKKSKKGLIICLVILAVVFMEVFRLRYTIEAVKVSKELKIVKTKNKNFEKEISKEKIKLTEKMDLNTMKKKAQDELDMKVSKTINYVKIKKSVSKENN